MSKLVSSEKRGTASGEYQEYHFQEFKDIGIAFCDNRIWVCMDGASLMRAKIMNGKLFIEYTPPTEIEKAS